VSLSGLENLKPYKTWVLECANCEYELVMRSQAEQDKMLDGWTYLEDDDGLHWWKCPPCSPTIEETRAARKRRRKGVLKNPIKEKK